MRGISEFNLCISALDDRYVPDLDNVTRLIDFLDDNLYLEGPDRQESSMVLLPSRETATWKNYLRAHPEAEVPSLRKRYVHLLYPPTSVEQTYRSYGELSVKVENVMPRDNAFVVSLGRGTRRLYEMVYVPAQQNEEHRWMQFISARVLRGYHALWDRVWDEHALHKSWQLQSVKGFTLMLTCRLSHNVPAPDLQEYLQRLSTKPEFARFLQQLGRVVGTCDFELAGEHGN